MKESEIFINQIGYQPNMQKRCTFPFDQGDIFDVIEADSGHVVYSGPILLKQMDEATGEYASYGDFTNLTTGINSIRSFEDWSLATVDVRDKSVKVCLMTDGVAETLVESRRNEFVKLLWNRLSEKNNICERNNVINRLLLFSAPVNSL